MGARFRLRHRGEELEVRGAIVIGRSSTCDVRVDDGMVSRRHARVSAGDDELLVEDLGSRNGVLVNERKITSTTLLAHGDVIGVGLQFFEVVDADVLDALSTNPPPPVPRGESDVDGVQVTVGAQLDHLTDREREVLQLVVLGHTQKEIASRLHVSVKTVETHRTRLAHKLGCRSRAELVSYAISAGLFRHM
jgi:DNA-binding CsgD family transcriptional regulator